MGNLCCQIYVRYNNNLGVELFNFMDSEHPSSDDVRKLVVFRDDANKHALLTNEIGLAKCFDGQWFASIDTVHHFSFINYPIKSGPINIHTNGIPYVYLFDPEICDATYLHDFVATKLHELFDTNKPFTLVNVNNPYLYEVVWEDDLRWHNKFIQWGKIIRILNRFITHHTGVIELELNDSSYKISTQLDIIFKDPNGEVQHSENTNPIVKWEVTSNATNSSNLITYGSITHKRHDPDKITLTANNESYIANAEDMVLMHLIPDKFKTLTQIVFGVSKYIGGPNEVKKVNSSSTFTS